MSKANQKFNKRGNIWEKRIVHGEIVGKLHKNGWVELRMIKQAEKDKQDRIREEKRNVKINKKAHQMLHKIRIKMKRGINEKVNQIQRGFDLAKKWGWRKKYDY